VVDERDIPSAWGIAPVDPNHLVSQYATSDNEDPALAQLSTRASVHVLYILKFEQCILGLQLQTLGSLLMKYSKSINISELKKGGKEMHNMCSL
jgi:hypothetical protein